MRQNLGQHFLKDKKILRAMAEAVASRESKVVVEIGPGHGELTEKIRSQKPKIKIIGIEKDAMLAENLRKKYNNDVWVEIIEGDARKILPEVIQRYKLKNHRYALVGNIPYYLTGHLFRMAGSLSQKPEYCLFMLQREVALRITETPPKMNLLAASVQYWGTPKILAFIPKNAFAPPPKVDSAIIEIVTNSQSGEKTNAEEEKYYSTLRAVFAHPRKTLLNNLRAPASEAGIKKDVLAAALKNHSIDPLGRPQNLSVSDIKKIREIVYNEADE